jgi:hypothetical protein
MRGVRQTDTDTPIGVCPVCPMSRQCLSMSGQCPIHTSWNRKEITECVRSRSKMTTAKARRLQNLRRRPPAPAKGRGRIQRQVRRAFEACGPRLSASLVYDWARRWQRRHDEKRINQRERYSIVRVLITMAVRDGRAGTRGRPWLWRRIESHSKLPSYE